MIRAVSAALGDTKNLAEISTDDGVDGDSTPNDTPGDDNQPANPGDPTDDVTDNTAGDEDDHDIAGLNVGRYDLALTKVYTSDTVGAPADGVVEPGAMSRSRSRSPTRHCPGELVRPYRLLAHWIHAERSHLD